MIRPLYASAAAQPESRDSRGHAGLWFDKFFSGWPDNKSWTMSSSAGSLKLDWIKEVTKSDVGNRDEIDECRLRTLRLVESRGGRFAVFKTASRFVTGLGRSHPVENGFAWHPTLGAPYLPGSSVKGLVLAWAKAEAGMRPGDDEWTRLFGSSGSAGGICFLDAVPVRPATLEPDVMTPHYAGWSEKEPPGDWMSPNPVPFLTVAEGNSFLFAIVPCRGASHADMDSVERWLADALDWAGGGAKTAVGYGRFRRDDKNMKSWAERVKHERRQLGAVEGSTNQWRSEIDGKTEEEVLDVVRINLEKEPLAGSSDRQAFAKAVIALYPEWVELWGKGMKQDPRTGTGGKKLKHRARLLDSAIAHVPSDTDRNSPEDVEPEGLEQDTGSLGGYPIDDMMIRSETRTVYDVNRRMEKGNFILDPDFQRDFIWPEDKQSKLIESAIMRIPLPVFYLAEDREGKMVVVDGLQRLSTFHRFLNDQLKLKLPDSEELNRKKFSDLPARLQNRVEDINLIFYIIDSKAPERARLDIFERVNSGEPLTRQQMRNSLYMGKATRFLRDEARSHEFVEATGGSLSWKKMRDREFINRFCAFQMLDLSTYKDDMDEFLAECLKRMNTLEDHELSLMSFELRTGLANNFLLFGKHAFRRHEPGKENRSILNASFWDVMSTGLSKYSVEFVKVRASKIREAVYEMLQDDEFVASIRYGPNSTGKVRHRFRASRETLQAVLGPPGAAEDGTRSGKNGT